MKKVLALILVLAMCFGLLACGAEPEATKPAAGNDTQPAATEPAVESDKKTYKVGLSFALADIGQTILREEAKKYLEENTELDIEVVTTVSEGSSEKQMSDVEDLIAKQCDLIYILVNDTQAIIPAVEACKDAGIICGVGSPLETDAMDFVFLSFDSKIPGQMQADWFIDYVNKNPGTYNIGHVSGTSTNSGAVDRLNGFKDTIMAANLPGVTWAIEQDCGYTTELAQSTVEGWMLSHPEVNVLVCANDEMCLGALNAVRAAGREGEIMFLSIDGNPTILPEVAAGAVDMTVKLNAAIIGQGIAAACIDALQGDLVLQEGSKNTMNPLNPFGLVDATTIDDYWPEE